MEVLPLVADDFESFTPEHGLLVLLLAAGAVVLGRIGARQRRSGDPVAFRRGFAIVIPVFTLPLQVLQLLPGDFDLETSLPIQVCDLSWMVAVYALWTRSGRAISLLYFWGLTLDFQAVITPSLGQTFPDPRYFMFWGMHFLTFWATVYLVCLAGGPGWRGYRFALACTAVWAAAVLTFNELTDTNYGYLSAKPESASLLDLLGPWPVYVVAEVAVLAVGWALMTWPWVRAGRTVPVPPGRSAHAAAADAHQGAADQHGSEPHGDQGR